MRGVNTMTKKFLGYLLTAVMTVSMLVVAPVQVEAQSLWGNHHSNMFADRKAGQVGDILTIIISESASTSMTKGSANSKSGSNKLNAGAGVFGFLAAASASGEDSFKANGSATNSNKASGTVTVTVTEVRENGNLVVEGTQSIWNNNNEHKITLNGIIRSDDITYNNTIPSSKVANATLKFDGKGPINSKQRQGILTQIFNILF